MKLWIITVIAATYFAVCYAVGSNEVIKNIEEEQKGNIHYRRRKDREADGGRLIWHCDVWASPCRGGGPGTSAPRNNAVGPICSFLVFKFSSVHVAKSTKT